MIPRIKGFLRMLKMFKMWKMCKRVYLRSMAAGLIGAFLIAGATLAQGADRPQWGNRHDRNMASGEKNLPETFNPQSGKNVRWAVDIGTKTYSTPIIAGGKVFIGTNNDRPRDPRRTGDFGVLMCFNESDGKLAWQLVTPKLLQDRYLDWPRVGICSPVTVQGDRVYVVTNRAEVVCLDINGLANGNDGPFKDEEKFMTQGDATPVKLGKFDADIIWRFDMPSGAGIWPHDSAHSSIMIVGDHLYLNTGNGTDNTHKKIRRPDGPCLIVLDKASGKLIAADAERIGPRIFHAAWSAPSMGEIRGKRQVYLGGPDGVVYALEPVKASAAPGDKPIAMKRIWRFDCDPSAPKVNIHTYLRNRKTSPSVIYGMPVFHKNRIYATHSGDVWWGKRKSGIKCIDATKTGDVTRTAEIWSRELSSHCTATPAIVDGLVYLGDLGGNFYCLDAADGKTIWAHKTKGEVYGSTLAADSKIYVGTRKGQFLILAAGRTKKILADIQLDSPIHGAATAANRTIYIATMKKLYAAGVRHK
jgi:outer membrane protein assembly factor BamB